MTSSDNINGCGAKAIRVVLLVVFLVHLYNIIARFSRDVTQPFINNT